jgi:tetratricopeptide (TPR) repeat protein
MRAGLTASVGLTANPTANPTADMTADLAQARAWHQAGQLDRARQGYLALLARWPGHAPALAMLGLVDAQQGQLASAALRFEQSLRCDPAQPTVLVQLGRVLGLLQRDDDAMGCFRQAIALQPDLASAHANLGQALRRQQRLDEALRCCQRAVELAPGDALGHYFLGNVLRAMGCLAPALRSYQRSTEIDPQLADGHWNQSLLHLMLGDLAPGWRLYEWRWRVGSGVQQQRRFAQPLWLGETPLAGKTLLVHAEQGLGDTLQMCRYLPALAAQRARLLLQVPARLTALLATLDCPLQIVDNDQPLPPFDLHCPIMSLPLAMKTTLATVPAVLPAVLPAAMLAASPAAAPAAIPVTPPAARGYLAADPARVEAWRRRLGPKTRPRVGLVWRGAAGHPDDARRSAELAQLQALCRADIDWHGLQIELRPGDQALADAAGISLHCAQQQDFADTAALLSQLDLVIAVDTSVAHLAGAMGLPLWLMLAQPADFRWLLDRSDSPWYPSARLFRQSRSGDWADVLQAMAQALVERWPPASASSVA